VALESTIISHGMPYPDNVAMATEVEAIVRGGGAVPATVAVLAGRPRVGLSATDLDLLASDPAVTKVSTRDLGHVVARGGHGATTVAATMRLAALAGIPVFVTGGLGGVHRGAGRTFDESADLIELSRSPVAVVCAGVKSVLDIGLTLERLETLGVPVLAVGTGDFPAFWTRSSGFRAPLRCDTAADIAATMRAGWSLGLPGGLVVANPIRAQDEVPAAEIDALVARALADAHADGVTGRDVTPHLLRRLVELSGGASLRANVALVRHNAELGAAVAVAYAGTAGDMRPSRPGPARRRLVEWPGRRRPGRAGVPSMSDETYPQQPSDPVSGTPDEPTGAAADQPAGQRGGVMPTMRSPRDFFEMVQAGWPFGQGGWPWREAGPWRDLAESGGHLIRVEESTEGGARVVRAELPGVDPEKDVSVTIEDDTLVISARREERSETRDPESYRSEFRYGSFTRHVRLPRGTTPEVVSATYRDGVLEVRLPIGPTEETPRRIPVSRG
ncbi:MAG: pseudouridine-5'-phosphate glycosidase, partial [Actinomycetales bacterium]